MIRVRFDEAAREELLVETAYNARQQPGLAARFVQSVEDTVARIVAFPHAGTPGPAHTRRAHISDFPFSVVYRVEDDEIVVFALAHHARRPGYWRDRSERAP
ncbi:MAG: type II toxin-antitoxin system RelE/ParE family toxin [Chloroflexota bacterium]